MNKTDRICALAKEKSRTREAEVLQVIARMQKEGRQLSFYSVAAESGASRSFLYNNPRIHECIVSGREKPGQRAEASKDVIIAALKRQIRELEKETAAGYREKYEKCLRENEELKRQLKAAYPY